MGFSPLLCIVESLCTIDQVPVTEDGIAVAALLKRQKALVTSTAVYNSGQALAALGAGSDFIAPYLGRMNNAGRNVSRPAPQKSKGGGGGPTNPQN